MTIIFSHSYSLLGLLGQLHHCQLVPPPLNVAATLVVAYILSSIQHGL
jgi:hypothetical protein